MIAWQRFLEKADAIFGKKTVDSWLRPLEVKKFDACNLYLEARDTFQVAWFEEHFREIVKEKFKNNNYHEIKVHIAVKGEKKQKSKDESKTPKRFVHALKFLPDNIRSEYSLEQYIPGEANYVPHTVLCKMIGFDPQTGDFKKDQEVSASAEQEFNPVYIYGPSGSGKTHLLMAAATAMQFQGLKVLYVTADTFTDHVVAAIRAGKMQEFRDAYRHVDALLIDDVQNLARRGATQEEFHHTFNTLHTANKRLILSGNVAPQFLEHIEDRLISRFEWGITFSLKTIHHARDLSQIASCRAHYFGFSLKKETLDYLVHKFPTAPSLVESLEAIAMKVELEPEVKKRPLPLFYLTHLIDELASHQEEKQLVPADLLKAVADAFGIKSEDIMSKSQTRDSVLPRKIAMYLLRNYLSMPYMKIGALLDRDHSTVMTSIKQITSGLGTKDSEIVSYVTDIERKLAHS